jgi:threonylcarbamoyladenosine tRNA methylthiotransferase MtaB
MIPISRRPIWVVEQHTRLSQEAGMAKRFKIITLGCKVNQCESAYIREALVRSGWTEASRDEKADVNIVNTCIVTQRASYQSRQAIRKAVKESPSAFTAAIGCYAQVFPQELAAIDGIALIAGNSEKKRLPDMLRAAQDAPQSLSSFSDRMPFDFSPGEMFSGRTRGFLKIQDGCDSFCSYCIVPYARGPVRSLDPRKVVSVLGSFAERGYKEVVLTGIHMGRYGIDLTDRTNLKELLRLIGKSALPLRIRLSSIEPKEIDEELVEMVASEPWLCKHFHIPLQSGDDAILKRMNRKYSSQEFANLVQMICNRIHLAAVGVDVMAGFPGEDESAFHNTFTLIRDLPISYLHVFPFSPRRGTPAASFTDRVNEKNIKERAEQLRTLGGEKRQSFYRSCLGEQVLVLAEGWEAGEKKRIRGFTENYVPVLFPASRLVRNEMVPVLLRGLEENQVTGSMVRSQRFSPV